MSIKTKQRGNVLYECIPIENRGGEIYSIELRKLAEVQGYSTTYVWYVHIFLNILMVSLIFLIKYLYN